VLDGSLKVAINRFVAEHNNTKAKPFIWRVDSDEIIAAKTKGSKCWNQSTRINGPRYFIRGNGSMFRNEG
jgi:hypothetical protein